MKIAQILKNQQETGFIVAFYSENCYSCCLSCQKRQQQRVISSKKTVIYLYIYMAALIPQDLQALHRTTQTRSPQTSTASSFVVRIVREKTRQYFTQAQGGTQRRIDIFEKQQIPQYPKQPIQLHLTWIYILVNS